VSGARTRGTSTSSFGVGRRENHDATDFYARFALPEVSRDDAVASPPQGWHREQACIRGDSRRMALPDGTAPLPDGCVALVVTSPPYFAGKEYEEALGQGHIPGSYVEYLALLRDVFAECKRVLEPGGRIAVNVANLGRKPYRSLSADVIRILQDDLGLLLRAEIVWQKGSGAAGNCAWGSFRSAANPVLRDLTERVIVASKGRFDRAKGVDERRRLGLPCESAITTDEFLEATLDVWHIPPESARRVHHPAPFPVELPMRLIELYTYRDDLVLDPFMGSGSALVAAIRSGRRGIGYDTDAQYVETARRRVGAELARPAPRLEAGDGAGSREGTPEDGSLTAWAYQGKAALAIAEDVLTAAGFHMVHRRPKLPGLAVEVSLAARAADDTPWFFDVTGAFTAAGGGLARSDVTWKALGRAHVLANNKVCPVVFITSHLPPLRGALDAALRAAGPRAFFDAVEMLSGAGQERLRLYAGGGRHESPVAGFWTEKEIARL
jgi:site-specific DNA-methyltransferase (adenine-specific)